MAAHPLSLTVDTARSKKSWRSSVWSLASSLVIQAGALVALALLPLFSMGALPEPEGRAALPKYVPIVPVARPRGGQKPAKSSTTTGVDRPSFAATFSVPTRFSDEIPLETEWLGEPAPGVPDGVFAALVGYGPAPAIEVEDPAPSGPIRVGGDVAPPTKRHHVNPVYPPVALAARIEGTVELEAIIDPDGNVSGLRVLRSIPLLDGAAMEAVRQWKYEPTRLNDRPVQIVMKVTVSFVLRR